MNNILFIQNSSDFGGASNALIDIVCNIDCKRFKSIVLLYQKGPVYDFFKKMQINVYTKRISLLLNYPYVYLNFSWLTIKRILTLLLFFPQTLFYLIYIFKKERIEIVYLNTSAFIIPVIIARLFGKKVITHIREIPYMHAAGKIHFKLLCKYSNKVLCNSNATRKKIIDVSPNAEIAYDWVDKSRFVPGSKDRALKQMKLENGFFYVGFINLVTRGKGIFVLLEAASIILKKRSDVKFLLVGGFLHSSEKEMIIQKCREIDTQRIILWGPTSDVLDAYNAMDIVISPNILPEGFGKTIIEAMLMKKCLIASDIGPTRELIIPNVTAALFKPGNSSELANKILYYIDNKNVRVKMGHYGREHVIKNFLMSNNLPVIYNTIDSLENC